MPVNIYDKPADAQFINTYERMPVDQIMQAGLASQNRWDRGEALETDILESLDVDALKKRTPQKQAAIGKLTDEINQIISETGNEYHKALPKLERLHKKVRKELTTEGELGGLQAEYNQRVAYETELDEMIKAKTMTKSRKAKLLAEADRRHGLTSALGKDEYGTWTKDQWAGLTPVEHQELGDAFNAILKDMPDLTVETLGQWLTDDQSREHRNRVLPPGMYEAINTTIKNKGAVAGLQETLQIIAMTDPKYRDFVAQSVELEMGQLEAQEAAVPGTKNRLLENSEVDLDLMRQLEEAGIDIYSQEGQDIILRKTLERDLTESILYGPISTAIARQGGSSLTMDRDKHTPPKHVSSGNNGGGGLNMPTFEGTSVTADTQALVKGDDLLEINENIAAKQAEIDKMPEGAAKIAEQEALQLTINNKEALVNAFKNDPANQMTTAILENKPEAPANASQDLLNSIENMTSDSYVPDTFKAVGKYLDSFFPNWHNPMFKADVSKRVTENVRNFWEAEQGEVVNLVNLVEQQMKYENPDVSQDEIAEMQQYALKLYAWQDEGGFGAEKKLNNAIADNTLGEELSVHQLQPESIKELYTTHKNLSKVAFSGGNAKNYNVINSGNTGDYSGESLAAVIDGANIDESKTMISGYIAPSRSMPKGGFQLTLTDSNKKTHNVVVTPRNNMTVQEGELYMNMYGAVVEDLDHGPAWIEAAHGADITDNFDLSQKGLTKNHMKVVPDSATGKYKVERGEDADNLEVFTFGDALQGGTGTYKFAIGPAYQAGIQRVLNADEMAEVEEIGGHFTNKGKINPKIKSELPEIYAKIETILDDPILFDNKGQIKQALNTLDNFGSKKTTTPATAAVNNIIQPRKNAGGYARNNNNVGNITDLGFQADSVLGKDNQGHAVFKTPEAGWAALKQKVKWFKDGKSKYPEYQPTATLAEMSGKYAESPDDLENLLGFLNKLVNTGDEIVDTDTLEDTIARVGVEGFANAIAAKEDKDKYLAFVQAEIIKKNLYS